MSQAAPTKASAGHSPVHEKTQEVLRILAPLPAEAREEGELDRRLDAIGDRMTALRRRPGRPP